MTFGADKPFVMKIACAIFPPSLRFAQAGLAAQKIVMHLQNFGKYVMAYIGEGI